MTLTAVRTPALVALDLADVLNERAGMARCLLVRAVREVGPDVAYDLAARALFIEATGGLQLGDPWNRKRTPGGVFFYLLKDELDDEQHLRVFGRVRKAAQRPPLPHPATPTVVLTKAATAPAKAPERPCAACGEQADVVAKFHFGRAGKQCICVPCADLGFVFGLSGEVQQLQEASST
jgi:hypothetical protein